MSLDQLILSYLLSQIKHMQQGNQSKSQSDKETTKTNKRSSSPKDLVIFLMLTFEILGEFPSIHWKSLNINFYEFARCCYSFFLEALRLIGNQV